MKPLIQSILLAGLLLFANFNFAVSNHFFSDSTVNEMRENLDGFLRGVPQNKGQRKHITRVLEYPEHDKLMLFIDTDYSEQSIAKISKLKEPFLLLETLDIISVNLGKQRVFSNYFIDEIAERSRQESLEYMSSFFNISKKSNGYYSEYLYEKLLNLLEREPGIFLSALGESMAMHEICDLLKLGDREYIINIINSIDGSSRCSKTASRLVKCLKEKK